MFTITNHHSSESCGAPPVVDWEGCWFRSYFENHHGEQWLLWGTGEGAWLAGGDLGWDQVVTLPMDLIRQGGPELEALRVVVMQRCEQAWFVGCLLALHECLMHRATKAFGVVV